jgi:hypothetical protein
LALTRISSACWKNKKKIDSLTATVGDYDPMLFEDRLGIPASLAELNSTLFFNLPRPRSKDWPSQFLSAIQPGRNLRCVSGQLMHWMLNNLVEEFLLPADLPSVRAIAALYERRPKRQEWLSASDAAVIRPR